MNSEAINPGVQRDIALAALKGTPLKKLRIQFYDADLPSDIKDLGSLILGIFTRAAPEIVRKYPEARGNFEQFMKLLNPGVARQLELSIRTKTRGIR